MNNKFISYNIIFFLICYSNLFAQAKPNELFNTIEYRGAIIPVNSLVTNANNLAQSQYKEFVQVVQIGNNNLINTEIVHVDFKNINYTQVGNDNNIAVTSSSSQLNQKVSQVGNENSFTSYNYTPQHVTNTVVTQTGNNQKIDVFGENSMSKDMQIIMTGGARTLIIRNFN